MDQTSNEQEFNRRTFLRDGLRGGICAAAFGFASYSLAPLVAKKQFAENYALDSNESDKAQPHDPSLTRFAERYNMQNLELAEELYDDMNHDIARQAALICIETSAAYSTINNFLKSQFHFFNELRTFVSGLSSLGFGLSIAASTTPFLIENSNLIDSNALQNDYGLDFVHAEKFVQDHHARIKNLGKTSAYNVSVIRALIHSFVP